MNAHTPGPWKVSPRAEEFSSRNPGLVMAGTTMTATVYGDADARLIAAAPDLLDLAYQLLTHAENLVSVYGDNAPMSAGIIKSACRARELIAKVKGSA